MRLFPKSMMVFAACVAIPFVGQANIILNDTITAIYGTGNPDSGWVSSTQNGSTLALMADNRHTGVVPNNGDGSYTFPTGFDPSNPARALWNFAFSVNVPTSLYQGGSYWLSLAGPGLTPIVFNVKAINDNAYGVPGTPNGGGTVGAYGSVLVATTMQNSENIMFFGGNPNLAGDYQINLFQTPFTQSLTTPVDQIINSIGITVHVVGDANLVPDGGSTLAMAGMALLPIAGFNAYKRSRGRRESGDACPATSS